MAKELPYFRWFPADAESDSKYTTLRLDELGLFHRIVNHSWLNDGVSADLEEMALELRIPHADIVRMWPRVSRCFYVSEGRFRNKRQEHERDWAISKSKSATDAVRKRYERNCVGSTSVDTNELRTPKVVVTPRAYGSGSISESGFGSDVSSKFDNDFSERFSIAWARHRKNRGGETKQLVAQILSGNEVDWDAFDRAHVGYCEYWARHGWKVCPLTMLEWWRNGMPDAPQESVPEKPPRRPNYRMGEGIDD